MEYIFLFIYFVYGLDDEANNDEGENSINLNLMISVSRAGDYPTRVAKSDSYLSPSYRS